MSALTSDSSIPTAPVILEPVAAPAPHPDATRTTRHLPLRTAFNLRDLGGYRTSDGGVTRWRRVLRADGIHRVDDADVATLAAVGLRTVVDLRTTGEVAERGRVPVERWGARHVHLPVLREIWDAGAYDDVDDVVAFLAARYVEMLDEGAPALTAALELLADDAELPLVFHCSAGKDRTGVLAAVLLDLLGVDRSVIAHDYGLSRSGVRAMRAWVAATVPEALDAMNDQPAAFFSCPPAAMRRVLAHLDDAYGGAAGWAVDHGLDDTVVTRLRRQLVAPA